MNDGAALERRAEQKVRSIADELIAVRDHLAEHPESKWEEHASAAFLTAHLEAAGFAVQRGIADLPTAFRGVAGNGPTRVGIVLEYDALPGLGHACGHNIIAAAGLGAAIALAEVADDAGITVEAIGSPAEEGGGGKVLMLDAGVFDGLDLAMMIHPGPVDSVWARPRAVAHLDVAYTGKEAHASAYPELGVNAGDAMVIAQVAIGMLRQQLPQSARVHGIVTEAGTAPNAIPAKAGGHWYVRADTLDELDELFGRVLRCFEAGALATGCEFTYRETSPRYSEFVNDEPLLHAFAQRAAELGRDMDVEEVHGGGMNTASTDMGNVSRRLRAIHPYLGIDSLPVVNHQEAFADATMTEAGARAVIDGAVLLARTALADVLASPRDQPAPERDPQAAESKEH